MKITSEYTVDRWTMNEMNMDYRSDHFNQMIKRELIKGLLNELERILPEPIITEKHDGNLLYQYKVDINVLRNEVITDDYLRRIYFDEGIGMAEEFINDVRASGWLINNTNHIEQQKQGLVLDKPKAFKLK